MASNNRQADRSDEEGGRRRVTRPGVSRVEEEEVTEEEKDRKVRVQALNEEEREERSEEEGGALREKFRQNIRKHKAYLAKKRQEEKERAQRLEDSGELI